MKRLLLFALLVPAALGAAIAAPAKERVKSVRIYPSGVYVTLSVPVSLKSGTQERVALPDLWYAARETVEVRLAPGAEGKGVTFVPEITQAVRPEGVSLHRQWKSSQEWVRNELARLRKDSLVLAREVDFLQANARQEARGTGQLAAVAEWIRERYAKLYEEQRNIEEAITVQNVRSAEIAERLQEIAVSCKNVTLVTAQVDAPGSGEVEFEISYYATAAEWKPLYFFRFDPDTSVAELDYQATVRQWTGFRWDTVPAVLGYGQPTQTPRQEQLHRHAVTYEAPAPRLKNGDLVVDIGKFGGNYAAEDMETKADVSYRLEHPLTLYSSTNTGGQTYQTVEVRSDTLAVSYGYEVTAQASGGDALLMAYLPGWQRLHLRNGRMNIFYDGRMLGQSDLRVSGEQSNTLSIPLAAEPLVTFTRKQVQDYQSKGPQKTTDRNREYELRVRNDKAFPIDLTVRDQHPVASSDQVAVTLTGTSGAEVDPRTGMLVWRLRLAPGEARTLRFGYTVRYPREGKINL